MMMMKLVVNDDQKGPMVNSFLFNASNLRFDCEWTKHARSASLSSDRQTIISNESKTPSVLNSLTKILTVSSTQ